MCVVSHARFLLSCTWFNFNPVVVKEIATRFSSRALATYIVWNIGITTGSIDQCCTDYRIGNRKQQIIGEFCNNQYR